MVAPSKPRKKPVPAAPKDKRTMDGWRGNAIELTLGPDDLPLIDNVLTVAPLLRIVTALGQEARQRKLRYPVKDVEALQGCLGRSAFDLAGHRIEARTIGHAMPESWFPIVHEGELLSRIHLALLRCEFEAGQMAPRPVFHSKE
jgi:hypothetical protein